MSLFYMTVRNINKATQSAVASASYRSGEFLYSERDMEVKSYKERTVLPETHIIAPSHAPEWVFDRSRLWNEVESVEKNYNSRLAREVLVALPVELSNEKQTQMLLEFAKENFVENGMVADISIHRDREHNPHAHIMLTTRPFNDDGTWGNKKKKEYILDENGNNVLDEKGRKTYKTISLTNWDEKDTLLTWRKNYAEKVNLWYEQEGINEKVSHESYEKQGLDKLPKQRLSLQEYRIEKREKENAEKNGTQYTPKTYYGKLNQEIEIQNRKIEEINKKVVSLEKYRELAKSETVAKLDQIRDAIKLSQEDRLAIKKVASRVRGYVDYQNAKDNLIKLSNWKKKIDYEKRMLDARAKIIIKAKEAFNTKPEQVLLYGIQPNKFDEQFNSLVNDYKADLGKFNNLMDVYSDIYQKSQRVLDIQREFTVEEFNFLYPKYAEIHADSEKAYDVKAKYVSLFKEEGNTRTTIPEFDGDTKLYQRDFTQLSKLIDDWKDVNKSLVILERTKERRKEEYRDAYKNNYVATKVYNAALRYTDSRDQVSLKEKDKAVLSQKLFVELVKRYPDVSPDYIKKIPSSIQSKVLELHCKEQHTGKLSHDLQQVKDNQQGEIKKHDNSSSFKENNGGESTTSVANAGDLLNVLISSAQTNEQANDDLEKRRKWRKKQNKNYREIGENEL